VTSADTVPSVEAPPAVGTDTPRGDGSRTARGAFEAVSAAADVLLADAALDRRVPFVTPGPALRVAAVLRGGRCGRRGASLGTELTRVAPGRSQLRASRRDRRLGDYQPRMWPGGLSRSTRGAPPVRFILTGFPLVKPTAGQPPYAMRPDRTPTASART
jgi:hypothetical protein